jgi:hypothetical protein
LEILLNDLSFLTYLSLPVGIVALLIGIAAIINPKAMSF